VEDDIKLSQSDNLLNGVVKATAIGGGLLGGAKYGKRAIARGIDTFGFGANVQSSYQGTGKIAQFTNNLLMSGGGQRRAMPLELIKSIFKSGNPVEINAMINSLDAVEEHMSKLKSQGRKIPKAINDYYQNLKIMVPERRMAQAVIQRSMKQPINFKHGGKFIENALPQIDMDIKKALTSKGFNVAKPFTVFDVSDDKFMIKKMRQAAAGDPRMVRIARALKANDIDKAKKIAKLGEIRYKGELIPTFKPIELVKKGEEYVAKYVPHFAGRGGKIQPVKEYVVGGHTQKIHFKRFDGHKGFHKNFAEMFDITSYASAGEKVRINQNPLTNLRIGLAGETGRKLGIHEPIVTRARYEFRAPGGGRVKGAVDTVKRKSRSFVEASAKTLYGTDIKTITKNLKSKDIAKVAKSLAKGIITKGKRW
jgi:hypothetical protein